MLVVASSSSSASSMWARTSSKGQKLLAAEPLANRFLKARYFSLKRRANQPILGCEGIDKTALADSCTLGDGIERENAAPGREDHILGGVENSVPIDFFFRVTFAPCFSDWPVA